MLPKYEYIGENDPGSSNHSSANDLCVLSSTMIHLGQPKRNHNGGIFSICWTNI